MLLSCFHWYRLLCIFTGEVPCLVCIIILIVERSHVHLHVFEKTFKIKLILQKCFALAGKVLAGFCHRKKKHESSVAERLTDYSQLTFSLLTLCREIKMINNYCVTMEYKTTCENNTNFLNVYTSNKVVRWKCLFKCYSILNFTIFVFKDCKVKASVRKPLPFPVASFHLMDRLADDFARVK